MMGVSSKNSDYLLLCHVDCIYNVSNRLLNVPKERFIEKTVGFLSKPTVFMAPQVGLEPFGLAP